MGRWRPGDGRIPGEMILILTEANVGARHGHQGSPLQADQWYDRPSPIDDTSGYTPLSTVP